MFSTVFQDFKIKIKSRILWNPVVNVTASDALMHFLLEALSDYQIFSVVRAGLFRQVHKIYHRTQCPAVLICKEPNKQRRFISNFTNRKTFLSLVTAKYFWRYSHAFPPLLATSKKGLSFPFSLAKKRICLKTHLKEQFTDLF